MASLANAPATAVRRGICALCAGGGLRSTSGQAALLCVYGMPALPSDKAYQLWLIKDGKRENGGVFQVSDNGFGFLMVKPAHPLTDYSSVGITVEPIGGSPAPTSPRVLGGNLKPIRRFRPPFPCILHRFLGTLFLLLVSVIQGPDWQRTTESDRMTASQIVN